MNGEFATFIDDSFEFRERKRVHTVAGSMDRLAGEDMTPFAGVFEEYPPGQVTGSIVGEDGKSDITGELREGELLFVKWPIEESNALVSFRFQAVDNGVWEGTYESIDGSIVIYGATSCQTKRV